MGYYIHYGEKVQRTEFSERRHNSNNVRTLFLLLCLLIFLVFSLMIPFGECVLSGNPKVMVPAGRNLISNIIVSGDTKEAFSDFCKVIIADE